VLFKSLSLASGGDGESVGDPSGEGVVGADDFLPLLIWTVLTSGVTDIFSTCEYVQAYLNPYRLMSRAGYCLVNLQSAAEFIDTLEADSINMDPVVFSNKLAEYDTATIESVAAEDIW
jgi:hypothetical protein